MTGDLLWQILQQRRGDDWLVGADSHEFARLVEAKLLSLRQSIENGIFPKILLAERDPIRFLAGFIAAGVMQCPVFLANPDWAEAEWQQVLVLVQPDWVWGAERTPRWRDEGRWRGGDGEDTFLPLSPLTSSAHIFIPTGGSSGRVRFAMHSWQSLGASVQGFCQYFGIDRVHSCCVLPLYHVSGLMQFLRSFLSGGRLAIVPFQALQSGQLPEIAPESWFVSLVPTQLQRLMHVPAQMQWLARFHAVLLGGAPAWQDLLEKARDYQIRLAPTYGMTETASQVVTLKPEDFLQGMTNVGRVLPHAEVQIWDEWGDCLDANQIGLIQIRSRSLALGYYPQLFADPHVFQTDDLGYLDEHGYLHVVGRNSRKIVTGGENVFPTEIEAAILATGWVTDVCVLGVPDRDWGEVVTAVYVPQKAAITVPALKAELRSKLSPYKCPKHWIVVASIPRRENGKINYEQLLEWAIAALVGTRIQ